MASSPAHASAERRVAARRAKFPIAAPSAEKVDDAARARAEGSGRVPRVYSKSLLLQVLHAMRPAMAETSPEELEKVLLVQVAKATPPGSPREETEESSPKVGRPLSEEGSITSVILMNIPSHYTREMVCLQLEKQGLAGAYDFLYLPVDRSSGDNLGYFLIDFVSHEYCSKFISIYRGALVQSRFPGTTTGQLCEVRPAAVQGMRANLDRVRWHNCFGLAAFAKAAGFDNVAARHLAAEADAWAAARGRAAKGSKPGSKESTEAQVRKQIEFYFSASNLGHDHYLRSLMDPDGWIELAVLVKFPRLHNLGASASMVVSSLIGSSCVEASPDGRCLRHANAILREVFPPTGRPKTVPPDHSSKGDAAGGDLAADAATTKSSKRKVAAQKRRAKDRAPE